jgi:NAD(P)-dependent dehydrogenase (short-subunit alcohol dehydrogenase family)
MLNTQFESERIVILGGTSGIGLATAERAAADGATVIVASSSAERIDAALERLPASAEGYTVDVRREEQIRDLFNRLGSFDHLAYWTVAAAVCGALDALTRALAVELAPIRVNAVAPGVVRSDLWRQMSEEDRSAMYDVLSEALPVGRVGEVGDIAQTFLYLMRNGYSSGTVVTVDGGSVLV